ncbi:hypothetical protein Tco_0875731 [Tanacetum coccineum]|uniref:Uncharacterized protein n=1 Tax=Tanacetum coccineum TaxID=301880 RepID=A0ABQ5BQC7_9ASTR
MGASIGMGYLYPNPNSFNSWICGSGGEGECKPIGFLVMLQRWTDVRSWKSRMELYMMNKQHGRMILESVENGLLIWPTIEENGVTRPKKYSELSATEAIQADCDIKATNIILSLRITDQKCSLNCIGLAIIEVAKEIFSMRWNIIDETRKRV